jgi:hypothetical protein
MHGIQQLAQYLLPHFHTPSGVLLYGLFQNPTGYLRGGNVLIGYRLHHAGKYLVSGAIGHPVLFYEVAYDGARL